MHQNDHLETNLRRNHQHQRGRTHQTRRSPGPLTMSDKDKADFIRKMVASGEDLGFLKA